MRVAKCADERAAEAMKQTRRHLDGCCVGPVHIVQCENDRLPRREQLQQLPDCALRAIPIRARRRGGRLGTLDGPGQGRKHVPQLRPRLRTQRP